MGNFIVCMTMKIQFIFLFALLFFVGKAGWTQGCNFPQNLCQSDGATAFNTNDGNTTPAMPLDVCFESTNLVFIEFSTLSDEYINSNGIGFNGTAQINISGLNCDTSATPVIGATVVSLGADGNLCATGNYDQVFDCVVTNDNIALDLNGLEPDSTYYLIINTQALESDSALACDFEVAIAGPAVEYDLDATANPPNLISGETTTLESSAGFENYEWSGDNLNSTTGQNTDATLEEDGGYTYTVTAEVDGCEVSDQVLVQVVPALEIPNTITPNGDGLNDTWRIGGLHRFPDAELRVYSRWGQLVYRTRGYTPWDGGGLPEAVYYYHIDLNPLGYDTRPYTGYLTIIR